MYSLYFTHMAIKASVCVFFNPSGWVQRERGTPMSSCSVPALHLLVSVCWGTLRYNKHTRWFNYNQRVKRTAQMSLKFWPAFSPGVRAELPPGAFRVSGGFHSRGRSQRLLLPQSHDLTCGGVLLQCIRWQRSLSIHGEIICFQLVNQ